MTYGTFDTAITEGLQYWDLHGLLFIPTLWLLTLGTPKLLDRDADSLTREACLDFVLFILCIAVAQAFVWDSVGARIGIWVFNPAKCTDFGDVSVLPVEEVSWLFHHVVKAALWQLKMFEWPWTVSRPDLVGPLPSVARWAGNLALLSGTGWGAFVLGSDHDELKCLALVAAFFSPVLAIIFNLGNRYWRSHGTLFLFGWLPPGLWTVTIDCIGQQQGVWFFPEQFLSGLNWTPGIPLLDGLLKLDIAAVYLVSTFAVTATGAIILAVTEELRTVRLLNSEGRPIPEHVPYFPKKGIEPNLIDLALFIFGGAFPGLAKMWLPAAVGRRDARYDATVAVADGATLGGNSAGVEERGASALHEKGSQESN